MSAASRIVVAEGAWAAEACVLAEIERALPVGRVPAAPAIVVVPSRSLREHLLGRLAARRDAWLGLEVTTLLGLAAAVLRRGGAAPVSGAPLVPLLVRRLAARERALASALGALADGYDEIAGAVSDLLDAGFVEEHLEAVEERLAAERATVGAGAVERAQAIARVSAGLRRELAARSLVAPGDLLAQAAQRLGADPVAALPAAAVIVHGFVDLTGLGSDLLEALVRHRPTVVVFDSPRELAGGRADWRFGRRLRERLRGVAAVESAAATAPPAVPRAFHAADPAREALAAVGWLAAGSASARWEEWALVAREIGGDLAAWMRELDRQGVPCSSETAPAPAAARRAAGILELLARGGETPLGVALAVAEERLTDECGAPVADLRLAYALGGARTLDAATRLPAPTAALALPIADRLDSAPAEGGPMRWRELSAVALAAARGRLAAIHAGLASLAKPRRLAEQVARFGSWLAELLPAPEAARFAAPIRDAAEGALGDFEADAEEFRRWVEGVWADALVEPLGAGGGVALLSVTAARGRTFERLALCGLTRDRFPRPVRSDPLLPDALRLRLRELLPDLPVKAEGHDEERFLFAQLVGSAHEIACFRPLADGQGRSLSPSPLLDELLRGDGVGALPAPPPPCPGGLEAAVGAALGGDLAALPAALAAAVDEGRERFGDRSTIGAAALAAARLRLLAQRSGDPSRRDARQLGAFLGAVGAISEIDPRRRAPSVTALERLAGCGWRLFLERVLRLAPLPELVDALPSLPRRLAGNVVHRVLEELLPESRGTTLAAAAAAAPRDAVWPEREPLARRVRAVARQELAREGLDAALFEATLAREAEALLAVARRCDWPQGRRALLAVEATGEAVLAVAGAERRIGFRVDRVERLDGELLLTDYKTGKPLSQGVRETTRARHLATKIASGEALQLPVYLLGAGEAARARYLHLAVDLDERARELSLAPAELAALPLPEVFAALLAAWDGGAFVPRLLERDRRTTFAGCAFCEVRAACVQGDSAARQRLASWAESAPGDSPWESAAQGWWRLRPAAAGAADGEAS